MTDAGVQQAMRIRYDLTAAQAKLTDHLEAIQELVAHAVINERDGENVSVTIPIKAWRKFTSGRVTRSPRAGSPRELHPDACPDCEIVAGHTTDCPTQTDVVPSAEGSVARYHHARAELERDDRPTPPPPPPDYEWRGRKP